MLQKLLQKDNPSHLLVDNCLAKAAGLVGRIFGAINTAIPTPPSHAEKVAAGRDEKGQEGGCAIS